MADRLEAAIRAQRAFVANASHQLRTPLTGMKLRLETAMEEAPPGDFRRQLEAADKEVDRLSEIVDDLLATSRERETTETHGEASADLGRAATRAVSRWEAKAVRARATLTASGPGAVAAASEPDVDQILDNLIDNALSHAPGSAVAVVADRTGEGALLAIQDDGPGIRAEELDLVTERFYRGKGATPGGSGLGLAIVRELAERWGGRLEVHSAPREGTRVQVTFPAVG
jgi:signal transduction histidine kinase